MDEDAGRTSPKTLADVSHLFFSGTEEAAHESPGADATHDVRPVRTQVLVVTGGDDAPGKSTVAVNLAYALAPFGSVALFDADPRVPNARYFLGLPSWNYLSPLTGNGAAAPNVVTDAGLLVMDWSHDGLDRMDSPDGDVIYGEAPETARSPLDFVVVDTPASRSSLHAGLADRRPTYVLTARPDRRGFESVLAALKVVRHEAGLGSCALVVNGASDEESARAFHAKTEAAAERLLSVSVRFLGTVPTEPGLGVVQRERGAIVISRPDGATALSMRGIASNALALMRSGDREAEAAPPGGHEEEGQ